MANYAELINASVLTSDPAELKRRCMSDGHEYAVIAEGANRIPIPWMCCFREKDLQVVTTELQLLDGGSVTLSYSAPRVSVRSARENLHKSIGLFEKFAGKRSVAKEYWLAALDGLENLPLPYLTIDPVEVLCLNDPDEEAMAFAKCFSGLDDALPFMRRLAFFDDRFKPYSLKEYTSRTPEKLNNVARLENAVALNALIKFPEFWYWRRQSDGAST